VLNVQFFARLDENPDPVRLWKNRWWIGILSVGCFLDLGTVDGRSLQTWSIAKKMQEEDGKKIVIL
jgi:hypothetical protein